MNIRCGCCREVLKDDDIVKIDFINTLTHYTCISLDVRLIKKIATYEQIKQKYWYYRMELVH